MATRNPGVALYRRWRSILEAQDAFKDNEAVYFGQSVDNPRALGANFERGPNGNNRTDRPLVLGIGHMGYGGCVAPFFQVKSNGEFRVAHLWGAQQRTFVARHTFLDWGHYRGQYNWHIDLSQHGSHRYWGVSYSDWRDQYAYLGERQMGSRSWVVSWLKPVPDADFGWTIGPGSELSKYTSPEMIASFHALRKKRYERLERCWKIAHGEIPAPVKKPRRVRPEAEVQAEREATLAAIVAQMDVHMPARSTPLRRAPQEEGLWQLSGSH